MRCLQLDCQQLTDEAVGSLVEEEDKEPIAVAGGEICSVNKFPYLGSLVVSSGRVDGDANKIAQVS